MKWRVIGVLAVLVIVIVAAVLVVRALRAEGDLRVYGTIEVRNIRVGSKVGGRISEVRVREGDVVEAGQVLVRFEMEELLAALEQARANLEKLEHGFRVEEVAEARAAAAGARERYDELARGYRSEQVAAAAAEMERARAEVIRTETDHKRANDLANADVYSRQQREHAEAAWKVALAQFQSAEQKFNELKRGYRPEQVASAEAAWKQAEATLALRTRGSRQEDIEFARAQLRDAEARYEEREVRAPARATVEVLDIRPGDLVTPNKPIATLLETGQMYVRIYVPEPQIGHVRLGQKAELRVDSFPGEVFAGEVEQINQQAEFLPRNVQTKSERQHQVFGVKVRIENRDGKLRSGMAADVRLAREGQ